MDGADTSNDGMTPVVSYQEVRIGPTELLFSLLTIHNGFDHFGG